MPPPTSPPGACPPCPPAGVQRFRHALRAYDDADRVVGFLTTLNDCAGSCRGLGISGSNRFRRTRRCFSSSSQVDWSWGSFLAETLTLEQSFGHVYRGGCPLQTSQTVGLTSHFGVARPVASVTGLRRSGWRRSADHGRGSLRELAQDRVSQRKQARLSSMIAVSEELPALGAAHASQSAIMGRAGGALRGLGHVRFTALPIKMTPGSAVRGAAFAGNELFAWHWAQCALEGLR